MPFAPGSCLCLSMMLHSHVSHANLPLSIKRKRSFENGEDQQISKKAIKKRWPEKIDPSEGEVEVLDLEQGINSAIGKMNSQLIADWVAQRIRRFAPDLTMVELEDQYLPGRNGTTSLYTIDFPQTHVVYRAIF